MVACMSEEGTARRAHRSFKVPSFFVVLNPRRHSRAWGSGFDLDHRRVCMRNWVLEMMATATMAMGPGCLRSEHPPRG